VWRAVLAAPPDDVLRDRMRHIHVAQRAFLDVWRGLRPEFPQFSSLEALCAFARENHEALLAFVDSNPDLERRPPIPFRVRISGPGVQEGTVGEGMLQVAMHSTYHRGQVNARLRELGSEPPLVDYIAWVWWGRPAAEW